MNTGNQIPHISHESLDEEKTYKSDFKKVLSTAIKVTLMVNNT